MTIDKSMNIVEILRINEGIADILMASGMHCLGCIMAHGETLEQACAVHGIDPDALTQQINDFRQIRLKPKRAAIFYSSEVSRQAERRIPFRILLCIFSPINRRLRRAACWLLFLRFFLPGLMKQPPMGRFLGRLWSFF